MEGMCYKELFDMLDIKVTKHRKSIYEILDNSDNALTIEDIFLKLAIGDETISMSTIYRILDVFCEKGLAVKNQLPEKNKAEFELCRKAHKHRLICTGCDKVLEIKNCPLVNYERTLKEKTNFEIQRHRLDFFGLCPECQRNKKKH